METLRGTGLALTALLFLATPGSALEKTSVRSDLGERNRWDAGSSCSTFYANTCTGWLWSWSGFLPGEEIGVVLDPCCCTHTLLVATVVSFRTGSPAGYGFTGILAVSPVVDGCPGAPYQEIPFLPPSGGLVFHNWSSGEGSAVLSYTLSTTPDDPVTIVTDHPAAGPSGPQACGFCYPSTRVSHTFSWGVGGALCPGEPFFDGACNAELVNWGGLFSGYVPAVESATWGAIKSLYR